MEYLINKLLLEVDYDLRQAMLARTGEYANWQLLNNPVVEILMWQELRDRNVTSGEI